MKKNLDLYRIVISNDPNELTGVSIISLVESPAIEIDFLMFSKASDMLSLSIENEEKRICTGAILVPDKQIYRKDAKGYEHLIYATKEDIQQIVYKFFKTNKNQNVDLEHNGILVNGVTMFESFISDSTRGIKAPEKYSDLPEGTWFGSFHIQNDTVWNEIKEGNVKGFSICGLFDYELQKQTKMKSDLQQYKDLIELLKEVE
jgi:hypothetical protein